MSVQFGIWNFSGKAVDPDYLERVESGLAPYGPDDAGYYEGIGISIVYRAFHTTVESRVERQPHVADSGLVLTWDGRLDNRTELIHELHNGLCRTSTDVVIVASAYEKWGHDAFCKLIGDWALSIWDPNTRSLILAKDPIGPRHLYYSLEKDQVRWSTLLDPLVLFAGKTVTVDEEYIAGWLAFFPATHVSPYVGIPAVPPSSLVLIRLGKHMVCQYWDFDPSKRILYRTDGEYEDHFRTVFADSVRRRLRSDSPVLAELSGGIDSSSIVCMADAILGEGNGETPRLDTVSYYDDSEPNWNERPYFTKVEEQRGRTGCHIAVGPQASPSLEYDSKRFAATPASPGCSSRAGDRFVACVTSQKNRVLLSGNGGDEVLGGVPTPAPELEDLLASGHFGILAHQLKLWSLNRRQPWFHVLLDAARAFFPPSLMGAPKYLHPASWLDHAFARRNRLVLHGYQTRTTLFGPLPSFQENLSTIAALRRQLACGALPSNPLHEKRYPFLDRYLLEFLCAIPREQLIRPGQRRSLMRRALAGIVPKEVLNRRRKAFIARTPIVAMSTGHCAIVERGKSMLSASLGIIDSAAFSNALQNAAQGMETPVVPLLRTVVIENWLNHLNERGLSLALSSPLPWRNVISVENPKMERR